MSQDNTDESASSPSEYHSRIQLIMIIRNAAEESPRLKEFLKSTDFPFVTVDGETALDDFVMDDDGFSRDGWTQPQPVDVRYVVGGVQQELRWHTIYKLATPEYRKQLISSGKPIIETFFPGEDFEFPTLGGKRKRKTVLKKYRKTVKRRSKKRKIYK